MHCSHCCVPAPPAACCCRCARTPAWVYASLHYHYFSPPPLLHSALPLCYCCSSSALLFLTGQPHLTSARPFGTPCCCTSSPRSLPYACLLLLYLLTFWFPLPAGTYRVFAPLPPGAHWVWITRHWNSPRFLPPFLCPAACTCTCLALFSGGWNGACPVPAACYCTTCLTSLRIYLNRFAATSLQVFGTTATCCHSRWAVLDSEHHRFAWVRFFSPFAVTFEFCSVLHHVLPSFSLRYLGACCLTDSFLEHLEFHAFSPPFPADTAFYIDFLQIVSAPLLYRRRISALPFRTRFTGGHRFTWNWVAGMPGFSFTQISRLRTSPLLTSPFAHLLFCCTLPPCSARALGCLLLLPLSPFWCILGSERFLLYGCFVIALPLASCDTARSLLATCTVFQITEGEITSSLPPHFT